MRDIATYESNVCEELNLRRDLLKVMSKVMTAKSKIGQMNRHEGQMIGLLQKVAKGILDIENKKNEEKSPKRVKEPIKKFTRVSQSGLTFTSNLPNMKPKRDIEYYTLKLSGIHCVLRVKTKDSIFHVTCTPTQSLP